MNAVRAGLVLTWRGLIKVKHSPTQLLSLVVQPAVLLVLFVFMFGGAITSDWRTYLQYVLPGILTQVTILATTSTGVGIHVDFKNGIFDRFKSLPIARSAPLLGAILGDVLRSQISALTVLILGIGLGFHLRSGFLAVVAAYALVSAFAFALCWLWAFVGIISKTPQQLSVLGLLVMLPLTFGSNIYVHANTMPPWLQTWASANPISALADALRGLLCGGPVAQPAATALLVAALIAAIFAPLAIAAYRRQL